MRAKWVVVVLFYTALVLAVAQPAPKTADLLWIGVSFVLLMVLSACRLVEWLRYGRSAGPGRGLIGWYLRFMTDSDREQRHRCTGWS